MHECNSHILQHSSCYSAALCAFPASILLLHSCLQETLQALKQRACAAFTVDPEAVLLWDYFEGCRFILLEDQLHCTLQQARLLDGQSLLLDPIAQVSIIDYELSVVRCMTAVGGCILCTCSHGCTRCVGEQACRAC
jgi:hypothetical protein